MPTSMMAVNVREASAADVNVVPAPTSGSACLLATKVVAPVSIPVVDHKNATDQVDEMLTTDVGSCSSSDAESCSSVADNVDIQLCFKKGFGPLGHRRQASQRTSAVFRGTPLETIPGTPVASEQSRPKCLLSTAAPPRPSPPVVENYSKKTDTNITFSDEPPLPPPRSPKRRTRPATLTLTPSGTTGHCVALGPFGSTPELRLAGSPKKRGRAFASEDSGVTSVRCGVFGTMPAKQAPRSLKTRSKAMIPAEAFEAEPTTLGATHGAPQTPKKQARDAMLAKAKRNGVPVKVKLPDKLAPAAIHGFDHLTPMKKRPVFADIAGPEPAAAMLRLEPSMPVKKRVPCFLLEDTFRGNWL